MQQNWISLQLSFFILLAGQFFLLFIFAQLIKLNFNGCNVKLFYVLLGFSLVSLHLQGVKAYNRVNTVSPRLALLRSGYMLLHLITAPHGNCLG